MKQFIFVVCLILSLPGFPQAPLVDDLGYNGGSIPDLKKMDSALHFLVIGDWGRNGENYQKEVAAGMGKAAHDLNADFVIATGDNFYPYGVASTIDYHWISSFESIYRAQSLHVRWYPVLGNHDYISNPQAQVDYTKISSRWTMPSRYHSQIFRINSRSETVQIFFIDTDPMEKELRGNPPSEKYPEGGMGEQMVWLKNELADSKATWKIVVGHHPLYSGGWRKNSSDTRRLKELLEPIFNRHKVDAYICGHEHHLEHIKPAGSTHHIISGAGSEARPVQKHPIVGLFAAPVQGFATISITGKEMLLQFINHKDELVYSTTIKK